MKRKISLIILLLTLLVSTSCKNKRQDLITEYFRHLNNYESDSLKKILADDFKIRLTYTTFFYDRDKFFNTYLRNCKAYHQKAKILKVISDNEPKQFLVEEHSDYLKYLEIRFPIWAVTIKSSNGKITEILEDTTELSDEYFIGVKKKSDEFLSWLSNKYPDESAATLHETEGLFLRRLKEYVDAKRH